MGRFIEFVGNHWVLSGLWLVLLGALLFYLKSKAGKSVSTQQAVQLVNKSDGLIVDIRDKKEFEQGHIAGAVNIPLSQLAKRHTELDKHKEKPLIVVCQMGQRSGEAVKQLNEAGFSQVYRMAGGMAEWRAQSLPLINKK